jgi:hypothetical protein
MNNEAVRRREIEKPTVCTTMNLTEHLARCLNGLGLSPLTASLSVFFRAVPLALADMIRTLEARYWGFRLSTVASSRGGGAVNGTDDAIKSILLEALYLGLLPNSRVRRRCGSLWCRSRSSAQSSVYGLHPEPRNIAFNVERAAYLKRVGHDVEQYTACWEGARDARGVENSP